MQGNLIDHGVEEQAITEQAETLSNLLPSVVRRLFLGSQNSTTSDMPITQLRVCLLLQSGERTMTAISEEMGVTMSAVTQIADRLERSNMVERVTDREDRRVKILRLTSFGHEVLQARLQMRARRLADVLNVLPPDVRVALIQNLQSLLEACYAVTPELQNSIADLMRYLM